MAHRALVLASLLSLIACAACGPAAPQTTAPVAPVAMPVGTGSKVETGPAVAKTVAPLRRGASDAIKRAWTLDEPTFAICADFEGLLKTKLMSDLASAIVRIGAPHLTPVHKKCIEDGFAQTKELAVGSENGEEIVILRFDPSVTKLIGPCVTAVGDAKPLAVAGAAESWSLGRSVAATTSSGLFVFGSVKAIVERALAGRGGGASLAALSLGADEYLAWSASLFGGDTKPASGTLLVTADRLRIAADGDLPTEQVALQIEGAVTKQNMQSQLATWQLTSEQTQAMERLIGAIDLRREGRHMGLVFDLRGTPARQAADLAIAAELGVRGVREYISAAKQAEAKNTVGMLAKTVAMDWEREDDDKPRSRKKLVSYPAVPKTVPKGVKYQSSAADWKPWARLHFEMSAPQYYQYEIKAAKDGESAEIIARGDLNGDGKSSEFMIMVKVERKNNTLRVAPQIKETNPQE